MALPPERFKPYAPKEDRGLALAAGEYLLACLAYNLGKLLRVCVLPATTVA